MVNYELLVDETSIFYDDGCLCVGSKNFHHFTMVCGWLFYHTPLLRSLCLPHLTYTVQSPAAPIEIQKNFEIAIEDINGLHQQDQSYKENTSEYWITTPLSIRKKKALDSILKLYGIQSIVDCDTKIYSCMLNGDAGKRIIELLREKDSDSGTSLQEEIQELFQVKPIPEKERLIESRRLKSYLGKITSHFGVKITKGKKIRLKDHLFDNSRLGIQDETFTGTSLPYTLSKEDIELRLSRISLPFVMNRME
jgi:hypothetical protein